HQALLAAHDVLREGDLPGLVHRVGQQAVRFLAALVGAAIVGLLEIDRIDLLERHDLGSVDDLGGLTLQRLQLLVAHAHVLLLGELVPARQLGALDRLVALGTERLLLDARAAHGVELVEGHVAGRGRRVEADGNRHQPEGDRARAERVRWHEEDDTTRSAARAANPEYPRDGGYPARRLQEEARSRAHARAL